MRQKKNPEVGAEAVMVEMNSMGIVRISSLSIVVQVVGSVMGPGGHAMLRVRSAEPGQLTEGVLAIARQQGMSMELPSPLGQSAMEFAVAQVSLMGSDEMVLAMVTPVRIIDPLKEVGPNGDMSGALFDQLPMMPSPVMRHTRKSA